MISIILQLDYIQVLYDKYQFVKTHRLRNFIEN
jgi:hypothetical protein